MIKQSILDSFKESMANTGIGFAISWVTVYLCMKYIDDPVIAATVSCVLCTIWSFARSFAIRRYFNNLQEKENGTNEESLH